MKKILVSLLVLIVIVLLAISIIKIQIQPISSDNSLQEFLITRGSSVAKIGKDLKNAGLIKNDIVFKFYVQVTNSQNKIIAGEYELAKSLSLMEIVDILKKGPKEIWVTIPEGLRREEVALRFANALEKDTSFIDEFVVLTENKEGYLFPDTYLFAKTASAQNIVNRMLSVFDTKVGQVTKDQLIMASLLERETLLDNEKPLVSGVLYKRIENGWPLQVDATLQYALANSRLRTMDIKQIKFWEVPTAKDKEVDSPYNTYKNLGLPPTPISNPGLSSILASKNPQASEYWFYIHDKTGKIHFARDLSEHNSNIQKYLR